MSILKMYLFVTVFIFFLQPTLHAQQLPLRLTNEVDSLFREYNQNTPGCAIGVVRNDTLIYSKGYGMANLEYSIPITPETVFYLASVSKQFTAYAILVLVKEGKLRLDDDIRNYLSWLPDLKRKITIKHLLNHTSGIRDDLEMALYGGVGPAGIVTQELAINYIKSSRNLNFEPGQKYLYSNSNFVLLAEIVKKLGGKSFKEFADSEIFKPLGMKSSFFLDQPGALIKNRAASYYGLGRQFNNAFHTVYTLGDGGMFSNIHDLAKWSINFYDTTSGNANVIMQLTETGKLNNGTSISYALGIAVNEYKGLKQYTHKGGLAGYRTNIAVFPGVKMAFVILSNVGSMNVVTKSNQLADIFLKNYTAEKSSESPMVVEQKNLTIDTVTAKYLSGKYISDDGLRFSFSFKEQRLIWESTTGPRLLIQSAEGIFEEPNLQMKFVFDKSTKDTTIHQYFTGYDRILTKYIPDLAFITKHPELYTGVYYSRELESTINIILKDGQLIVSGIKVGDTKLTVLDRNNMMTTFGSHLKFLRDRNQKIAGLELNSPRMMHVRFDKSNDKP